MKINYHTAIGRRKSSKARVFLSEGSGKVRINNKDGKEYFKKDSLYSQVTGPFGVIDLKDRFDIIVTVNGGGFTGQIDAIRLGISRAILKYDASHKPALKKEGLLTRDSRMVERKKPGQPKARKKFQFSKR